MNDKPKMNRAIMLAAYASMAGAMLAAPDFGEASRPAPRPRPKPSPVKTPVIFEEERPSKRKRRRMRGKAKKTTAIVSFDLAAEGADQVRYTHAVVDGEVFKL